MTKHPVAAEAGLEPICSSAVACQPELASFPERLPRGFGFGRVSGGGAGASLDKTMVIKAACQPMRAQNVNQLKQLLGRQLLSFNQPSAGGWSFKLFATR